ncbi:hypothetical protein VNO78_35187 [Psophocarpus tetragonolobus]|uniref:Uncharacterized protein n=1 Tax=Psophocarpus tetragonolobus TaxID=3891 RepID=A0AAN9NE07_PSOTE
MNYFIYLATAGHVNFLVNGLLPRSFACDHLLELPYPYPLFAGFPLLVRFKPISVSCKDMRSWNLTGILRLGLRMPTHFDSREKPRKWKSDQRPGPSGPERQIFVAVLKLALSPLDFHYWTEFASDDANLIPFFQQGPLRLSRAQTLPIVRLVDEIGVPGEEEEKEDLNRKHMTIFQSSLGGCFATHPLNGTVFGKAR